MTQAIPSAAAVARGLLVALGFVVLSTLPNAAAAQAAPAPASGLSSLKGFVLDSVHNAPLAKATISIEGTNRSTQTDGEGHYAIDSIPPGEYRIQVVHPILDTLGVTMRTPAYKFAAGEARDLDLTIPGGEQLANALCPAAQRMRGPGAMLGFVRDPDSKGPASGSKVQLVYYELDPIGRKQLRQRESQVDSTGMYRICGLPKDMTGKVQVFRNGVSSGEVAAEASNGFITLRGFTVAGTQTVVEMKNDSGKVRKVALGTASVSGRVMNKKGEPLRDARVTLQGQGRTVITQPNGAFVLDSLPSGTQAIEVRRLGYSVTEVPVELSANNATPATITMSDAVPLLAAMRVEAAADKALSDIGYLQRKQMGMGYFLDGKQINHESMAFSDVLRVAPGLRIQPAGDGRTYVVTDSRSSGNGCVNFYVDGTPWQTMQAGDIDTYVRPAELVAVEVYHGSETPAQYTTPGQSSCATIVAWTQAKISTMTRKKK
jgi:hypothetical protein